MPAPDFLAIGHATLDRFGGVVRPGGAALYAAVTAHRLGLTAAALVSHGPDFPLDAVPPQIEVVSVEAAGTTTFEHRWDDAGRRLRAVPGGRPLGPADVPEDWREAGLVLLAPVLQEVDPSLAEFFGDSTVAVAAQGWLRDLDRAGDVVARAWQPPPALLGRIQALFLSAEDVRGQEVEMLEWLQRLPLAAVTAGASGALLYVNSERYEVRPRPTREVDPTGAGDVFAAAFLIHYHREGDPWAAAALAACAASLSVEGEGWSAIPDASRLAAELETYLAAA
jgi:1D-myo-inositol 3-kinase